MWRVCVSIIPVFRGSPDTNWEAGGPGSLCGVWFLDLPLMLQLPRAAWFPNFQPPYVQTGGIWTFYAIPGGCERMIWALDGPRGLTQQRAFCSDLGKKYLFQQAFPKWFLYTPSTLFLPSSPKKRWIACPKFVCMSGLPTASKGRAVIISYSSNYCSRI